MKKTLLTCDDVFKRLTSGPFSTHSGSDTSVNEHIAECASCRELSEALRPACHLIHESLPDDLREGLPVVLSADDVAVERVMARVEGLPRRAAPFPLPSIGLGIAAAACFLVIAVLLQRSPANYASLTDVAGRLRSLDLPDGCIQLVSAGNKTHVEFGQLSCDDCHESAVVEDSIRHRCCTECHRSMASHQAHVTDVSRLLAVCSTCH